MVENLLLVLLDPITASRFSIHMHAPSRRNQNRRFDHNFSIFKFLEKSDLHQYLTCQNQETKGSFRCYYIIIYTVTDRVHTLD